MLQWCGSTSESCHRCGLLRAILPLTALRRVQAGSYFRLDLASDSRVMVRVVEAHTWEQGYSMLLVSGTATGLGLRGDLQALKAVAVLTRGLCYGSWERIC